MTQQGQPFTAAAASVAAALLSLAHEPESIAFALHAAECPRCLLFEECDGRPGHSQRLAAAEFVIALELLAVHATPSIRARGGCLPGQPAMPVSIPCRAVR